MPNNTKFFIDFFKRETETNKNIANELLAKRDQAGFNDFNAMAEFYNNALQQLEQNANADIYTMFETATCDIDCLLSTLEDDYERPDLALMIITEVDGRKAVIN